MKKTFLTLLLVLLLVISSIQIVSAATPCDSCGGTLVWNPWHCYRAGGFDRRTYSCNNCGQNYDDELRNCIHLD